MDDELETIATFSNSAEARLAQRRLENAGIQAVLVGEAVTAAASDVHGITLQVPAGDAAEARSRLADVRFDSDAHSEQITTTPTRVPTFAAAL